MNLQAQGGTVVARKARRWWGPLRLFSNYGLAGFFSLGTARGMSPSSRFIVCGVSWLCSFGGPPPSAGGVFGIGIFTVAMAAPGRKIAPPPPATHALSPPPYPASHHRGPLTGGLRFPSR